MRLVAIGHSSDCHWIVRKESPVKSIQDYQGRRVVVGAPGSGTLIGTRDVLKIISGLTFGDFKPAYLTFAESITGIRDGSIDVGLVQAGYPVASVLDLSQHHSIRLISYTDDEINRLTSQRPFYVKIVIPSGTYRGVDEKTVTHGSVTAIFCRQDISDDLVNKVVKAIYEHPKERNGVHPQAKQWSLEYMFRTADYTTKYVPFHPGTIQYLKEKGLWK
jgi:TRAP transporter TAXI family solute receptor